MSSKCAKPKDWLTILMYVAILAVIIPLGFYLRAQELRFYLWLIGR